MGEIGADVAWAKNGKGTVKAGYRQRRVIRIIGEILKLLTDEI
ncbi:hypothetical protein H1P_50035 [Hyella patelloides LEGE 07179]|uniref:Uncharacterized protein n=1 Tax=Hyella patelloides LEGE 07179 TaxID=945734 RepID=A0A563VZI5_9CYAN|nr:hypothetical protein H1P_50035 [Hyella patelloides LEGE 07179]